MSCYLWTAFMLRSAGTLAMLAGLIALLVGTMARAHAYPVPRFVRTESGTLRCIIKMESVACEASGPGSTGFSQAPIARAESQCHSPPCPGVIHFDMAQVTASGTFSWSAGDIAGGGTPEDQVLRNGETVQILGWAIESRQDGPQFTKSGTGHGMFVSIDNVRPF